MGVRGALDIGVSICAIVWVCEREDCRKGKPSNFYFFRFREVCDRRRDFEILGKLVATDSTKPFPH